MSQLFSVKDNNLRIAANNTRAAKSQFYPTLQINATGAWTNNLGEIVNPGKMLLTFVGSLTQPLFQQGRIKSEYKIAQSQENQAQIAFSQSVGYLEVLTAQSTYLNALLRTSADQLEAQQAKINLYKALCR